MDSLLNDMIDFISLCRNQYKGNKIQLNILREFQQNYSSDHAIWWFTRDTFITELLNKALRIQNIDLLFLLRFFIHDMEKQLKQCQCLTTVKVYRYQLILNQELEVLRNSIGQFISINNFLLTNVNRNSVLPHSKLPSNDNDYQPVLFEIVADPHLDKIKPFGNITSQHYSPNNQEEILFMLGSIFQLNNIRQDENDIWIIEMTLSSRTNESLKSIFDNYKNDDNDDTNLLSFGYLLQKMNRLNETEKYYHRLLDELPDEDERIGCCCLNLGNIAFTKTNYETSLEWLFKSLDISMRTLQSNDTFLALIYNSIGHVYNAKNDFKTALEYYNKAIIIWRQSIDDNYLNIAECMNHIGVIYKQEKNYSIALECFKKILIILEKYLSNDHFDLSKSHCNIASICRQLGYYDLALEHYNSSFQILEKYYSSDHPNIAKALGNIGVVYALKGEYQKALIFYEKTADIYRQTLPPTHINNIKITQLIRNISSPDRKVSFGLIESR
jgi:tetratricopeptide (TPR) repeat protein